MCLRSHSYNQMSCMWCYLLLTLSSVYISSLVSVSCATQPSAYHSTFSYSQIINSFECLMRPKQLIVTPKHPISNYIYGELILSGLSLIANPRSHTPNFNFIHSKITNCFQHSRRNLHWWLSKLKSHQMLQEEEYHAWLLSVASLLKQLETKYCLQH
jgi:hypothetical protein